MDYNLQVFYPPTDHGQSTIFNWSDETPIVGFAAKAKDEKQSFPTIGGVVNTGQGTKIQSLKLYFTRLGLVLYNIYYMRWLGGFKSVAFSTEAALTRIVLKVVTISLWCCVLFNWRG